MAGYINSVGAIGAAEACSRALDVADADLNLKWRKTWDDVENDFSAFDPRYTLGEVGRIYQHGAGPTKGQWFWSLTASGAKLKRPAHDRGYANSAREAGALVEAAWFAAAETAFNSYAQAKDPG